MSCGSRIDSPAVLYLISIHIAQKQCGQANLNSDVIIYRRQRLTLAVLTRDEVAAMQAGRPLKRPSKRVRTGSAPTQKGALNKFDQSEQPGQPEASTQENTDIEGTAIFAQYEVQQVSKG